MCCLPLNSSVGTLLLELLSVSQALYDASPYKGRHEGKSLRMAHLGCLRRRFVVLAPTGTSSLAAIPSDAPAAGLRLWPSRPSSGWGQTRILQRIPSSMSVATRATMIPDSIALAGRFSPLDPLGMALPSPIQPYSGPTRTS